MQDEMPVARAGRRQGVFPGLSQGCRVAYEHAGSDMTAYNSTLSILGRVNPDRLVFSQQGLCCTARCARSIYVMSVILVAVLVAAGHTNDDPRARHISQRQQLYACTSDASWNHSFVGATGPVICCAKPSSLARAASMSS
jgi:hypothetical protein